MAESLDGLPPIVIAALKAPKGTTIEELRTSMPRPEDRQSPFETEFNARLEEATFLWCRVNSWTVPEHVNQRLRGDVLWEMQRDGWKR